MNFFILKYCLLIGAILTSTALVGGPLNPQKLFSAPSSSGSNDTEISADSVYQFGSEVMYKELDKPGNEYMKSNLEGYSRNLVSTDKQEQAFDTEWHEGVSLFQSGFQKSIDTYFELAAVRDMTSNRQKTAVCDKFRLAKEDIRNSEDILARAKASSTASSANGFRIGMVLARVDPIRQHAEDSEMSCMKAILADRDDDEAGFRKNLEDVGAGIKEMRRIYPELKVLSDDF